MIPEKPRNFFELSHSMSNAIFWSGCFLVLATVFVALIKLDWELYVNLVEEGAATERLSAIFYLVSGILILISARRKWRIDRSFISIILPILLGLFFIFVAGEEESWGQWIFDYQVSEKIQEVNVQNETNIHNLEFVSFLNPHRVLLLFVLFIGVLVPLVYRFNRTIRKFLNQWFFAVCPLALSGPFLIAIIFEKVAYSLRDHWAHGEAMEFFFSLAILLYGISVLRGKNIISN